MKRLALAILVLAGGGAWLAIRGRGDFRLPARLASEDLVADLSASFARDAVVAEDAAHPVRVDGIQPTTRYGDPESGWRRAIVASPPARIRFRAHVPPGAALRFSVAVQGPGRRDAEASGIRFAVTADGTEVFSRTVDPAATRHDRRWFDERADLGAWAGRDVELALETRPARKDAHLAGTPGWSHVRVVREEALPRQQASAAHPSVLVILVDTLRADALGCYGASPSPTPTADRLAASGLLFEQAIAQSSWTMPAVATLLTGLPPRRHGVVGESGDDGADAGFLPDAVPTLAERVRAAGITTVGVSANPLVSRATNLARGFETFVELSWDQTRKDWPPADAVNGPFLRWLARNRGLRFLAYLHYMEPHDPYTPPTALRPAPPPGIRDAIAAGDVEAIAQQVNWHGAPLLPPPEIAYLRGLYDAEVHAWDAALARLLDGVRSAGVLDSTIVVVTADHGEEFQEHGRLKHRVQLYDESIHVPLVVSGPGIRSSRVATQVQGIDFLPTVAALLGVEPPADLPGRDARTAAAERPAISETRFGIGPDGHPTPLVSARTTHWKLIRMPALGREERYDLARDPAERESRADGGEDGVLADALARWEATPRSPAAAGGPDPGLRAKLRALGYVE